MRVRHSWAAFAVSALLGLCLAVAAGGQEQPPASDPGELVNVLLQGLLGLTPVSEAELEQEVSEAGGIPFRTPVRLEFMDRAELARYFRELVDEEYPLDRAERDRRALAALDLLPAGTDLRELRLKLMLDNVIGFYDLRPGRKRLYAVSSDRTLTALNQLVLAHELRHALQDQHMALQDRISDDVSDFDDRRLALLSLLEGDATFVMQRFLERRLPEGAGGTIGMGPLTLPAESLPEAPAVLRDQLVQPYLAGLELVRSLFARGGWEAVQQAWSQPPLSTEQVLHPAKYLAGEKPLTVQISYAPPRGRLLLEGVLGEMLTRTFLEEDADPEAAAGWGGDLFRAWEVGGRTLLVWRSAWDSPEDRREFLGAAFRRFGKSHRRSGFRGSFQLYEGRGSRVAVGDSDGCVVVVTSDSGPAFDAALAGLAGARP